MDISLTDIVVNLPDGRRSLFQIRELKIPYGSRMLIHGPSGIGKTTLLHLIAGLFLPDKGDVTVGDSRMRDMNDFQRSGLRRKKFGIVFQRLNLIEHLNAYENVVLPLPPVPESAERAVRSLDKVNLSKLRYERVTNLSLGEQQRVAIARVLASNASIVLADEPTSSVDDKNAKDVIDALLETSENKTLVVVSHDHRIRPRFDTVADFEQLTSS